MNNYFTEVKIEDPGWRISYNDKLMIMGSCFSENIGEKFRRLKFCADLNPFGVIYNPWSVAKSIRRLISVKTYNEEDLFEHNGIWGSFDHHSRFSTTSAKETLDGINARLETSHGFLKEAAYLFITFGTAWAYELKETGRLVSNCHKFPATEFKHFRLSTGEVIEEYRDLLSALWDFNPSVKVIFTVSPVRHWKDGPVANQLSKATLLLSIDRLVNGFGNERCTYFPSYEIVMDELRDYRFYAADMIHVNQVAIDHIWDKFSRATIDAGSLELANKVLGIVKASEHRPLNPDAHDYVKFITQNLIKIRELTNNFPCLNLNGEKIHFEEKLKEYQ